MLSGTDLAIVIDLMAEAVGITFLWPSWEKEEQSVEKDHPPAPMIILYILSQADWSTIDIK